MPQGSVLGSLLFLIYINDNSIINEVTESFFADDTAIVGSGKTPTFMKEFSKDVQSINDWCNVNKLSMKTDKNKLMAFRKDLSDSKISIAGQTMENIDSFKYLVLEVEKKLSFNNQTKITCKKVSKFKGVLYRGKSCFSKQSLVKFYMAFVIPIISYGLIAYGCTSKINLDKIFVIQQQIIRTNFFFPKYDHESEYFSKYQLQNVYEMFISQLCSEAIFQFLEVFSLNLLSLQSRKMGRLTRRGSLGCLSLPLMKTKLAQKSVSYKTLKCFNFLLSNDLVPPILTNILKAKNDMRTVQAVAKVRQIAGIHT